MLVNPDTSSRLLARPESARHKNGDRGLGPDPDHDERQAPAGERELERPAEPPAADERDTGESTEDAADTERGGEDADARLADPEEVDRQDDEQHPERAAHERLGAEQGDHQPYGRVPHQRPRALPELVDHTDALAPVARRTADEWIPAIATNERNEAAAHAPKTAAGLDTARSSAATAGPSSTAVDSNVSAATFEAASSRGVRARSGASARWHGRCAASGTAARIAST